MLNRANPEGFKLQLKSLEELVEIVASYHTPIMASFSSRRNIDELIKIFGSMDSELAREVDIEQLILYLHVRDRV